MIFARVETEETQQQLQQALKEADRPYIYRRLLIIRFSTQGKTVNELSCLFQLTPLTILFVGFDNQFRKFCRNQQDIRKYIHAYNTGGIKALMPHKKPGRSVKLSLTKEQWLEILHQSPATFDELQTACHNYFVDLTRTFGISVKSTRQLDT